MTASPHNLAIAVFPQDTLHANKPQTKSPLGDQIPDFKVLGWYGGEDPSHSKSSHLFFLYEKKRWPESLALDFIPTTGDLLTSSILEQVGSQAILAFTQYDVNIVHVFVVVGSYFIVLKYERPQDLTIELQWHTVRPKPLCSF